MPEAQAESQPSELDLERVWPLIEAALAEDLGPGDVTTEACVPADGHASARIVSRAPGVVCGLPLAQLIFEHLDASTSFDSAVAEGQQVEAGAEMALLKGPARAILSGERLALNLLSHVCGIATLTRQFVVAAEGTSAQIYDTRKTTPTFRYLQRYAVRMGGGCNHRFGLFDQVLLKDNHRAFLRATGRSLADALAHGRELAPPGAPVEVEADTLEEALEAAEAGAEIVLLDNFSPEDLSEAVRLIHDAAARLGRQPPQLEASGGIDLDTAAAVARSGVDRIAIGAVTHSAPALDLSLEML